MHGIDISGESKGGSTKKKNRNERSIPYQFGDPESYKDMSMEEREELTQKMMGVHKDYVEKGNIKGGGQTFRA